MGTIGPTGKTPRPTVVDNQMRVERPVLFRDQLHKIEFYLHGIGVTRQSQQTINTDHMSIHGDSRNTEGISQNNIGRLPPHSRDRNKIFHTSRDFSAESLKNRLRSPQNILGFISIKTRTANSLLDFAGVRSSNGPHAWILFEKDRCHPVHESVRTLSREHGRHQELPRG